MVALLWFHWVGINLFSWSIKQRLFLSDVDGGNSWHETYPPP